MPILILSSGNGMQVQHNVQVLCGAAVDDSIKDAKPFRFDDTRVEIVFKVSVVKRNANAIQPLICEEFCIR